MNASSLPDIPEVTVGIRVYFFDTDTGGVVHNVAYLRMIEVARSELSSVLGWSLGEMTSGSRECPVVARTEIDYLKPARLGDDLQIHARLTAMEKIRFYIGFEVLRPADGTVICRCRQTMVTVALDSGRPRLLREAWRTRWPGLLQESTAG